MSVIGRLDPQVEDVLISPRERGRTHAGKAPPPAERSEPGPRPAEDEPDDAEERPAARGAELPVWML